MDSRVIAEALGVNHADWFQNVILKYKDNIEANFHHLRFENGDGKNKRPQGGGKQERYVLLDESQCYFLATLSRNTPQVITFKAKLVLSFAEIKGDFSKIYALWHELIQKLDKDDEQYNANIDAIEKAFQFVLEKCISLGDSVNALQTQVENLDNSFNNFSKEIQAQIASLQATQNQEIQTLDHTVERVDKIEVVLDFKAIACVYVMYCPRRQWYKIGSSHDAKNRK